MLFESGLITQSKGFSLSRSLPHLHHPLPASADHSGLMAWVPLQPDAGPSVSVQDAVRLAGLPVVAVDLPPLVPRNQVLPVRTEINRTGVPRAVVACKLLGPQPPEVASLVLVDHDLVVGGLPCKVLPGGVHGSRGDGSHLWFRDVPGDHWHPVLPDEQFLVVG